MRFNEIIRKQYKKENMSSGAYTILDSHVGKHEASLTATNRLLKKLREIELANLEKGDYISPEEAKPKLGDLPPNWNFYIKSAHKYYVAFAYEYFKSKPLSGPSSALTDTPIVITFDLSKNNGDFLNDMGIHITFREFGAANGPNRYKYCDFPGIRLLNRVKLYSDDVEIDSYDKYDMLHFFKTKLNTNDLAGWLTMLGQETTNTATWFHPDYNITQVFGYRNGPQTPKPVQPVLDLWIPVLFDFNTDISRSLNMGVIKTQQIRLEIELDIAANIIQGIDPNGAIVSVEKLPIQTLEIYTKNIYFPPAINDIFEYSTNVALIRVHKQHKEILTTGNRLLQLSQLKYPIEMLTFSFQPKTNEESFTNWLRMGQIEQTEMPVPALIVNQKTAPVMKLVARTATFNECRPTVKNIGFKVHGNVLYPLTQEIFYNAYIPYFVPDVATPDDCGYYVLVFAHYPAKKDPSGHINNSTARELYIQYESDYISAQSPVILRVTAQCINIMLYDKNTIKLKYIT